MEKLLAGLTNNEDVGILIYKNVAGFCFANDFICETLGYNKDELLELGYFYDVLHKDDFNKVFTQFNELLEGKRQKIKSQARFIRKNGTIISADFLATNYTDSNGDPLTVMEVENIVDTTEVMEDTNTSNFEKILSLIDERDYKGVLIKEIGGGLYGNQLGCKALGYNLNEIMQLKGPEIAHKESFGVALKSMIKLVASLKSSLNFDCKFQGKNGINIISNITLKTKKESGTRFVILIMNDITRSKILDNEVA